MEQSGLLFNNETPVTLEEIANWLDTIPNLSTTESRRQAYRHAYNVDEKIRQSKRAQIRPTEPNILPTIGRPNSQI